MPLETFTNLGVEKQEKILAVAIREFSNQPYAVASISAIVRDAGIAKGSFYQYFADKKDLYLHVLRQGMARKVNLVTQYRPPSNSLKTFDYLKWMMQVSVQFELAYPDLARIAYRAFVEEIPFPEEVDDLMRQGGASYFNDFLAQGILHDDVAPWVDTDMAAYMLQIAYYSFGRYLLKRIPALSTLPSDRATDIFTNPGAMTLFDNLMELLEGGMGRDPAIRKLYFSK
jgi:TetR/AcrR family transcriptional regulator